MIHPLILGVASYGARAPPLGLGHVHQFGNFYLHIRLSPVLGGEHHTFSRFNRKFTDSQSLKLACMTHHFKIILLTYLVSYLCHWKYTSSMTFNCKQKRPFGCCFQTHVLLKGANTEAIEIYRT